MEKPLHIDPRKKIHGLGLNVWCSRCGCNIYDVCVESGEPIQKCKFGSKHSLKVYVYTSENTRKTKTLKTRNIDEAIQLALEFKKEVKEINSGTTVVKNESKTENENNAPHSLSSVLARYIGFLHNENVPAHRQRNRSADHTKDVERAFKTLAECLSENGIDINHLSISDVNDKIVGLMYEYLLNNKKFSGRTFNKYFSFYTSLFSWFAEEYNIPIRNWFERVKRKKTNTNPESISKEEFLALIKNITPENGTKTYEKGKKPVRNLYRPWLADGFKLALETGRRREEITSLRFSDIIDNRNGMSYIKVEDYKVNRIQNRIAEDEKKYVFIPVTQSLKDLLMNLGYDIYKETDKFILAPEIEISRRRVMSDVLSKAFGHYYAQLGTDRNLTFKSLRKTYLTSMEIFTKGNADSVSQHSGKEVLDRHYIDKKVMANAAKDFQVFPESKREDELSELRSKSKTKQKELEVSK